MNDAELAILSIVAEGPIFGYDVQTVIEERNLRNWTNIGKSSMYYVLEKLERQGLIENTGASGADDPARRQYQITSAGFGVLQTSVADLLSTPREYGSSFELGLANIHVLRPSQIRTAFTAYRQELISRIGQERERLAHFQGIDAPFNITAMIEHQIALMNAELIWITAFVEKWEADAPPEPEPAEPPEPVEIPRMKQVVLPHHPDSFHRAPTRPLGGVAAPPEAETTSEAAPDGSDDIASDHADTTLFSSRTPPNLSQTDASPGEDDSASAERDPDEPPPVAGDDDDQA